MSHILPQSHEIVNLFRPTAKTRQPHESCKLHTTASFVNNFCNTLAVFKAHNTLNSKSTLHLHFRSDLHVRWKQGQHAAPLAAICSKNKRCSAIFLSLEEKIKPLSWHADMLQACIVPCKIRLISVDLFDIWLQPSCATITKGSLTEIAVYSGARFFCLRSFERNRGCVGGEICCGIVFLVWRTLNSNKDPKLILETRLFDFCTLPLLGDIGGTCLGFGWLDLANQGGMKR